RHGRVVIAESERIEPIVDAVSDYIARRLIEREKALAADGTLERAARAYAVAQETIAARREPPANAPKPAKKAGPVGRLFASFVEVSGSVLLCGLLALGAFTAWKYAAAFWFARHGWR
ncbi:MAG: hypothetical protein WBL57_03350, partial [Methylovirgula sp.]